MAHLLTPLLSAALVLQAQAPQDFLPRAQALAAAKAWADLEALARATAAARPKDALPPLFLGIALGEQGRGPESIAAFKASTRLAPGSDVGWFNLGLAALRIGDKGVLLEALEGSLQAKPSPAPVSLSNHPEVLKAFCDDPDPASHDPATVSFKGPFGDLRVFMEGVAIVLVKINGEGKVMTTQPISGPKPLVAQLEGAVRRASFPPKPLMNGATHYHFLASEVVGGGRTMQTTVHIRVSNP